MTETNSSKPANQFEISLDKIENSIEFEKTFAKHFLNKIYPSEISEFFLNPGVEHHRLLSYLSTAFNNGIIIDVATELGQNALALSYNETNTIHTFDSRGKLTEEQKKTKWLSRNIIFHEQNLWNANVRKEWKDTILSSSIVFVDLDPHDGYMEYELYAWLKRNKYSGIIIFDDIFFPGMKVNFWNKIPDTEKYDISKVGHHSGTGMVIFQDSSRYEIRV